MAKIIVQNTNITIISVNGDDYISLTDLSRHKSDELRVRYAVGTVIVTLSVRVYIHQISSEGHFIKNFAEFICHYKNFSNFVFGEHSDKSICL